MFHMELNYTGFWTILTEKQRAFRHLGLIFNLIDSGFDDCVGI